MSCAVLNAALFRAGARSVIAGPILQAIDLLP